MCKYAVIDSNTFQICLDRLYITVEKHKEKARRTLDKQEMTEGLIRTYPRHF